MYTFGDELLTGVEMVDCQHKAIFEMVNEYCFAMQSGRGYNAVKGMLDFLAGYVNRHFADEEKLMREIEYGRYAEHCEMHRGLTAKLGEYTALNVMDDEMLDQITQTIVDWLLHHIKEEDKDFAALSLRVL